MGGGDVQAHGDAVKTFENLKYLSYFSIYFIKKIIRQLIYYE